MSDLTPAEQAVAATLALDTTIDASLSVNEFKTMARAVAAAAFDDAVIVLERRAELTRQQGHPIRAMGIDAAAQAIRDQAAALRAAGLEEGQADGPQEG